MDRAEVGDEQLARRDRAERRDLFDVGVAALAHDRALLLVLAFGREADQVLVQAVVTHGADEAVDLPLDRAQPTAQEARELEAAVLAEDRPGAADRAIAAAPARVVEQ